MTEAESNLQQLKTLQQQIDAFYQRNGIKKGHAVTAELESPSSIRMSFKRAGQECAEIFRGVDPHKAVALIRGGSAEPFEQMGSYSEGRPQQQQQQQTSERMLDF